MMLQVLIAVRSADRRYSLVPTCCARFVDVWWWKMQEESPILEMDSGVVLALPQAGVHIELSLASPFLFCVSRSCHTGFVPLAARRELDHLHAYMR